MRPSLGPRAQAVLVLALVATTSALIGILADRLIASRRADAVRPGVERMSPPRGMTPGLRYSEGLATRLDLTPGQRAQIDSILAGERVRAREITRQFQPQIRSLADETRMRVEAVLTPEQREQLRTIRQQQRARRGDMRPGAGRPDGRRPGDTMGSAGM